MTDLMGILAILTIVQAILGIILLIFGIIYVIKLILEDYF